ncbi:patatin-like phospholipase domain-containing protein 2 [Salvelinus namaycush]|uniref:Patatin-like phospholipase domain-containing protein 2 n=1 Tax=Salvelinus namaycush TaxID=8040 RepID=A0A8U0TY76_SALNM|nr:patatin-like phospholipase domain-containing protein 2 [Salvelinus namaycush]
MTVVFCEACQQKPGLYAQVSEMLPVRVASYMLLPCTLPVVSAYSVGKRFVEWIPEVPADMRWLAGVAGDVAGSVYRQTWRGATADITSDGSLRNCMSLPYPWTVTDTGRETVISPGSLSLLLTSKANTGTSPPPPPSHRRTSPLMPSPSPRQICFFVGSQDETD